MLIIKDAGFKEYKIRVYYRYTLFAGLNAQQNQPISGEPSILMAVMSCVRGCRERGKFVLN